MPLFLPRPLKRYVQKVDQFRHVAEQGSDDTADGRYKEIVVEGISIILLDLERIIFFLIFCAAFLIGLLLK